MSSVVQVRNLNNLMTNIEEEVTDSIYSGVNEAGWHQYLGSNKVGNIATVQALQTIGEDMCANYIEARKTILNNQFRSSYSEYNGGWGYATNSKEFPTTEPTSWVVMYLSKQSKLSKEEFEALRLGVWWLKNNSVQEVEGKCGWGTTKGSIKRVYTTVLSLKALFLAGERKLDEFKKGIRWLESCKNNDGGWGEGEGYKSNLLHSAHVIILFDMIGKKIDKNTKEYLHKNIIDFDNASYEELKIELIDVIEPKTGGNISRLTYKHFTYPYALNAYMRCFGIDKRSIKIFNRIINQNIEGYCKQEYNDTKIKKMWSVFDLFLLTTEFNNRVGTLDKVECISYKKGNVKKYTRKQYIISMKWISKKHIISVLFMSAVIVFVALKVLPFVGLVASTTVTIITNLYSEKINDFFNKERRDSK